jgi:hypothetical protein
MLKSNQIQIIKQTITLSTTTILQQKTNKTNNNNNLYRDNSHKRK